MGCPDVHQRDQGRDGFTRALKGLQREKSEVLGKKDTSKGRNMLGKEDPTSSGKCWVGEAAREPEKLQMQDQARGTLQGSTATAGH